MTCVISLLARATSSSAPSAWPSAQSAVNVRDGEVHGRPGWILENDKIRIGLVRGGGHIGELRLLSQDPQLSIDPMFVPSGSGYMGHLVCFPHFGPASPEERKLGLRGHGEAGTVDWKRTRAAQIGSEHITVFYGADLPKTQYRIERAVTLRTGETIVRVEEWIENLAAYDRPYNHDQHVTFGAPFVRPGKTMLDMSGGQGMTDPERTAGGWAGDREFRWPDAPRADGGTISLREFRATPGNQAYTAVAADRSREEAWFTLYNIDSTLLVGYLFPTADAPWIIDWQNQPRAESADGTARGIEFGTSPFDEGLQKSVERGRLFGIPTYRWIAARERRSTRFTIFLTEIPRGFAGVQDVAIRGDRIQVTERATARGVPGTQTKGH